MKKRVQVKSKKLKKTSFLKNVCILLVAHVLIKIIGVINKIYLTNREGFGDEGNAIYSSAFQIYALFLTISSIGIPNAVAKLVSEKLAMGDTKGAHKVFKIAILTFGFVGFIVSTILFVGANYIACTLIQIPEAELSLLALSPSIFFVSITSVIKGYFNGRENLNVGANSQTVEQIFKMITTITIIEFIAQSTGLDTRVMAAGAAVATTLSEITCFVYLYRYYQSVKHEIAMEIKQSVNYKYRGIRKTVKDILAVSVPMSIGPIVGGINKNIDSMTIVRGLKNFMTETEAKLQYGILSGKIDTLVAFPLSFNSAFSSVLIPMVSSAKASGDYTEATRKIRFSMLVSVLIGLPSTVGMIILADPILKLLFPNQPEGAFLLQISALSITFMMLGQNINSVLHGLGKTMIPTVALGIGSTVKLLLNTILVKINPDEFILGGTAGAAVATVVCQILICLMEFKILKKSISLDWGIRDFVKPLIATGMMGVCLWFFYQTFLGIFSRNVSILLAVLLSVLIYMLLLLVLKVFSEREIKMLPAGEVIYRLMKTLKIY